jgi:hypothetical protein
VLAGLTVPLLIWRCRRQGRQDQIPEEAHVRPGQLRVAGGDGTADLSSLLMAGRVLARRRRPGSRRPCG